MQSGPLPKKEQRILELLVSEGPQFGLQLVDASHGELKRGTVYVTLARMEAKGLVDSEQEPRSGELPAGSTSGAAGTEPELAGVR